MDPNTLLQGRTRETSIRRDAQGRWYYEGAQLTHPRLVESFNQWLGKADDGRFCLKNDINWAYIAVEGPAHFVRRAQVVEGQVRLGLSNGAQETLVPESLRQGPDGALYCTVGAGLTARFESAAAVALADLLGEDGEGIYITLAGARFRPPVTDTPLT